MRPLAPHVSRTPRYTDSTMLFGSTSPSGPRHLSTWKTSARSSAVRIAFAERGSRSRLSEQWRAERRDSRAAARTSPASSRRSGPGTSPGLRARQPSPGGAAARAGHRGIETSPRLRARGRPRPRGPNRQGRARVAVGEPAPREPVAPRSAPRRPRERRERASRANREAREAEGPAVVATAISGQAGYGAVTVLASDDFRAPRSS